MKKSIALVLIFASFLLAGIIGLRVAPAANWTTDKTLNLSVFSLGNRLSNKDNFIKLSAFLPADPSLLSITFQNNRTITLYSLVEIGIQTNLPASNPYDPQEINLRVSFTAPSGKNETVGAFWYQDFNPKSHQPLGEPVWKVRFTPNEVGEWEAVAYAPVPGIRSNAVRFIVKPSDQPGFIRVNPNNSHYLAFDTGNFFFPIGVNMAWWDQGSDPISQYNLWLERFVANGGNTIRVWMADWSFGIEWKDTGLGNYNRRQYQAWLLDQLFKLAGERGVKIILVLINHGAFSLQANSEWDDNPYNASLGGPLSSPDRFVTDAAAVAYFRQRLNYIINRWGYSPDLLAWEWFNEVNLTLITDHALIPWLKEMTEFLHALDVNHHLATLSFAMRAQSVIWQMPDIDIVQVHEYSSHTDESEHDLAASAPQDFQELAASVPEKPILMGEFGYSASNYGDDIEKTGIHLHNGLWSTTFSGFAGSGMYWWWDIYIDPNNLWHEFNGLSQFITGIDLTQYQPFTPLEISGTGEAGGQAIGLGLRGDDILVWFRSQAYTVQAAVSGRDGIAAPSTYTPPLLDGLHLTIEDVADGQYTVSWFDPQTAEWLKQEAITSYNNTLTIPIPAFRDDLAAKITQNP